MKEKAISQLSYAQAVEELEQILAQLQSEATDIDTLAAKTARASKLIEHCKAKLLKTEKELQGKD